jgi:hypothetical protein
MQNLKITLLAALSLFLGASCTDFLTELDPFQSLPSSAAFSSAADLETALVGAYDALQNSDLGANGLALNANILSDNGLWEGSFPSYIDIFNRQMVALNPEVLGMWRWGYRAINQANLVIANLDNIEADQAEINRLRGEALFLRGMIHFEMVRYYGQPWGASSTSDLGIPIMTTPVLFGPDITFPVRNTIAQVYAQVIMDLTEVASLLPATGAYGRANGTAAKGYLAEVAFQQRDYPLAATLANEVITAGYMLMPSPVEIFTATAGSSEEIFAVVNTAQDNPGVNGSLATFHHVNGRGGDVVVSNDLRINGYQAIITAAQLAAVGADTLIDLRSSALTSNGIVNIEKYEDFTNNSDDLILVRLATFYLMRAEALARTTGINEESIMLLNTIRNRSIRRVDVDGVRAPAPAIVSYQAADFATPAELIEAIILERRVELAFEGNRLHDLRRLERDVRGVAFNADVLLFPIPQREVDANQNLVQNPGY